jgi:uncharacterized RmlC-like cupin family protein
MSDIRVVRPPERDRTTTQTSGMVREAGISKETVGARTIWSGYMKTAPGLVSGAHHHGDCESTLYVLSGRARFFWGDRLQHSIDVGPGDFIYVPPNEIHLEQNLSDTEPVEFIVSRGCTEMLVVNVPDPRRAGEHGG